MSRFDIRTASLQEFETAVNWAAAEGWNPGLEDLQAFHPTDAEGYLMGFADGRPVSSISVVRYGDAFAFLGFYIVAAAHRGKGLGLATWTEGIDRLAGRTIGLDGVVAQQANYRKSGFVLAGNNLRHTGVVATDRGGSLPAGVRPVTAGDVDRIIVYDRAFFPAARDGFVRAWVSTAEAATRIAMFAERGGTVAGYGVIRACRSGYKIGPLFAYDEQTAEDLFLALTGAVGDTVEVSLDTPDDNAAAIRLAERHGLAPVFQTARMYRGPAPDLPLQSIFGVTTFELG